MDKMLANIIIINEYEKLGVTKNIEVNLENNNNINNETNNNNKNLVKKVCGSFLIFILRHFLKQSFTALKNLPLHFFNILSI